MDDLDAALLDAWHRVLPRLRDDAAERQRRLRRRRTATLRHPPRAWCLALRASDTRLHHGNAILCPEDALDLDSEWHPGRYVTHEVTLTAELLRDLCAPVHIPWPGMDWDDVATLLGCHRETLRRAIDRGVLRPRRVKHLGGKHGPHPVPILYTDQPLDPAASNLWQPADPLWGDVARSHHQRIPDDLEQIVTRHPVYRPYPLNTDTRRPESRSDSATDSLRESGSDSADDRPAAPTHDLRFRGWRFECPGCKRLVRQLYYPLPVLTLPDYLGQDLDADGRLVTPTRPYRLEPRQSRPGDDRPSRLKRLGVVHPYPGTVLPDDSPPTHTVHLEPFDDRPDAIPRPLPAFACVKCHKVRYHSDVDGNSWNGLIAYLSAGLLFGHEVPKPDGWTPTRKRAYTPRRSSSRSRSRSRSRNPATTPEPDEKERVRVRPPTTATSHPPARG